MSIPVFKPSIRRRDMESVLSCLVTDQIGTATLAEELVMLFCQYLHRQGGTAFREHYRALDTALEALGLETGDKVVLSPLSPRVYQQVLQDRGLIPLFGDVRLEDACLDPKNAGVRVEEGARAVLLHAPLGQVPDTAALGSFGVPLIQDVGASLGARRGEEELLGGRGTYTIVSLEPDSIVTTGGGALLLAGDKSALKALDEAVESLTEDVFLADMNASLGLIQFQELDSFLEQRQKIKAIYQEALRKGKYGSLGGLEGGGVPFSFPVVLNRGMKEVRQYARKKGVETQSAFSQSVLEGASQEEQFYPHAQSLMMNTLLFPLYPALGKKDVQHIVKVLSTLP